MAPVRSVNLASTVLASALHPSPVLVLPVIATGWDTVLPSTQLAHGAALLVSLRMGLCAPLAHPIAGVQLALVLPLCVVEIRIVQLIVET